MDASLLNDLSKTADDLRVKDVFVFKPIRRWARADPRRLDRLVREDRNPQGRRHHGGRLETDEAGTKDVNQTGDDGSFEHVVVASSRSIRPGSRGVGDNSSWSRGPATRRSPVEERVTLRKVGPWSTRFGERGRRRRRADA